MENSNEQMIQQFAAQIKLNAEKLMGPHLVSIYKEKEGDGFAVDQVATGFLVEVLSRPLLISAKHAFYGPEGDENPGEKLIFCADGLRKIGDMSSAEIYKTPYHDLAAVFVDELIPKGGFPLQLLSNTTSAPKLVSIYGYLARDFKRDAELGILRPSPYIYTNKSLDVGDGYTGIFYPKNRNTDSNSGFRVMTPKPEGISGGPMLDSTQLASGTLSIVGVFTDKPEFKGHAFGESSVKVISLVQQIVNTIN